MVCVAGGSYAEYVAVYKGCVMKIPEGISMVEAAGSYIFNCSLKKIISHIRYCGNIFDCISRFTIDW
jgi:threonine dehydrogenase-like Zn-dependent dehydrogenase